MTTYNILLTGLLLTAALAPLGSAQLPALGDLLLGYCDPSGGPHPPEALPPSANPSCQQCRSDEADTDHDGVCDRLDTDDDNDGYADECDPDPTQRPANAIEDLQAYAACAEVIIDLPLTTTASAPTGVPSLSEPVCPRTLPYEGPQPYDAFVKPGCWNGIYVCVGTSYDAGSWYGTCVFVGGNVEIPPAENAGTSTAADAAILSGCSYPYGTSAGLWFGPAQSCKGSCDHHTGLGFAFAVAVSGVTTGNGTGAAVGLTTSC